MVRSHISTNHFSRVKDTVYSYIHSIIMKYDFVEIGTSDFDTEIQRASDTTVGLSIEPLQVYLDRLPNKPHVQKIPVAISDQDGEATLYYVPPELIESVPFGNNIWMRGTNCLHHPHPTIAKCVSPRAIQTLQVKTLSFPTLCRLYNIDSISYLKIDTEGHDLRILRSYLSHCDQVGKLIATKIQFETESFCTQKETQQMISLLQAKGYRVIQQGLDCIVSL